MLGRPSRISKSLLTVRTGINAAGSAIGCALCSLIADKFGRKRTIQGASVILIIGAAICTGSVNNGMFLVGRFINGLGIGALVSTIPMYQAEVSTPESRGFMVSMHVSLGLILDPLKHLTWKLTFF